MKDTKAVLAIDNNDRSTNVNVNCKYMKIMENNEELIGGCCVCSDDQGFTNNALVYCDGKDCTVACHTACYGIVSIPDGDWFCRRCETGEKNAPCQLCPLTEGAMKRTSDGKWAHVVCALYIPEVSFGNDLTMEPIIVSKIPSTRYEKICSICVENGRSKSYAKIGACCECKMKNCSKVFHVTCAQQAGLLYEDVRKNNCQYPIYCQEHQPKFTKFIRQIPSFHYKSSERKHNSNEKQNVAQLSDFVKSQSTTENKAKSNDEINQNSFNNLSQFIELSKETNVSSQSNQSTIENRQEQTPTKTKIKIEENDIDDEKLKQNKPIHLNKKRQHSSESSPRPVGRPPSKKTLLSQQKSNNISTTNDESQTKNDNVRIEFYPRRPLTDTVSKPSTQQTFPPQTLEEFLEQEWESTSDFLLQQTMPHDVSSLLSCLYQFKSENAALEKQFDELKHRRDSLRVTNANLRQKLSEILTTNQSQRLPTNSNQQFIKKPQSPMIENHLQMTKNIPSNIDFNSTATSLSYESINPYTAIKNERLHPTNGLSLELISQILTTTNSPQLFAPTWNISNFGYANFPGPNSISVADESILRSYTSFQQ